MSELDDIKVYGETDVGWCALTLPNETVDDMGHPFVRVKGFSAADPRAPRRRVYEDPEVCTLREHLRAHNGIPGLEILEPHEIERAARIFFRDGFVVVRDVLNTGELELFRSASAQVLKQILQIPGVGGRKYLTESYRLPHRYSYGSASVSRHLLHDPVWASMIDLPTTTPILTRIFGGSDYQVLGAGGDLCLPGAIEYQALHSDGDREHFQMPPARVEQARRLSIEVPTDTAAASEDVRTLQRIIERTPPVVTINFLMTDMTWGEWAYPPDSRNAGEAEPSATSGQRAGLDAALHAGWRAGGCGDLPRYASVAWRDSESEPPDTGDAQRRVHGTLVRRPELPTCDAIRNLGRSLVACAANFAAHPIPTGSVAGGCGRDASAGE